MRAELSQDVGPPFVVRLALELLAEPRLAAVEVVEVPKHAKPVGHSWTLCQGSDGRCL